MTSKWRKEFQKELQHCEERRYFSHRRVKGDQEIELKYAPLTSGQVKQQFKGN